jgi:hypothetical protein
MYMNLLIFIEREKEKFLTTNRSTPSAGDQE